ncbi:MAG: anti-sigma factor antagonist [Wenzhouxiangella sp.]|nr:MAG: anti-sigma factor antagonist [Wenzhouxiangella sp.]
MSIETRVDEHCIVAKATTNSIDASNASAFRTAMRAVIENHDRIVIDLGDVEFIDSAGIGTLIACLRASGERQGQLRLCSLNRPVQALFELMRMHRIFEVHSDSISARASMA